MWQLFSEPLMLHNWVGKKNPKALQEFIIPAAPRAGARSKVKP